VVPAWRLKVCSAEESPEPRTNLKKQTRTWGWKSKGSECPGFARITRMEEEKGWTLKTKCKVKMKASLRASNKRMPVKSRPTGTSFESPLEGGKR